MEGARYRVIDAGIEKLFRELSCLEFVEYLDIAFPESFRRLPDLIVMDFAQKEKMLVEVKYRDKFSYQLFECKKLRSQVQLFKEVILVCVNGAASDEKGYDFPERFIRGCKLI